MKIAFQGIAGAYSHGAVATLYPDATPQPHPSFEHAVNAVATGMADAALLPFENLLAGRVSGLHGLLSGMGKFYIHREHYVQIEHCLVGTAQSAESIQTVYSHPQALAQCQLYLTKHAMLATPYADTAAAAEYVAQKADPSLAAVASAKAAELYGLNILARDIANQHQNITRFLLWQTVAPMPLAADVPAVTSVYFSVKHRVNALYEVLSVFAEQNLNLLKIESYVAPGTFNHASFYLELEANTQNPQHRIALEKAAKVCDNFISFGCYPKQRA